MAQEMPGVQAVRLGIDVLTLGPVMVWAGWTLHGKHPVLGWFLLLSGVGTVLFNGVMFVRTLASPDKG